MRMKQAVKKTVKLSTVSEKNNWKLSETDLASQVSLVAKYFGIEPSVKERNLERRPRTKQPEVNHILF